MTFAWNTPSRPPKGAQSSLLARTGAARVISLKRCANGPTRQSSCCLWWWTNPRTDQSAPHLHVLLIGPKWLTLSSRRVPNIKSSKTCNIARCWSLTTLERNMTRPRLALKSSMSCSTGASISGTYSQPTFQRPNGLKGLTARFRRAFSVMLNTLICRVCRTTQLFNL